MAARDEAGDRHVTRCRQRLGEAHAHRLPRGAWCIARRGCRRAASRRCAAAIATATAAGRAAALFLGERPQAVWPAVVWDGRRRAQSRARVQHHMRRRPDHLRKLCDLGIYGGLVLLSLGGVGLHLLFTGLRFGHEAAQALGLLWVGLQQRA